MITDEACTCRERKTQTHDKTHIHTNDLQVYTYQTAAFLYRSLISTTVNILVYSKRAVRNRNMEYATKYRNNKHTRN